MNIKQSTARNALVFMTDSTDHITGKSGLTLVVYISKNAGADALISRTVTEIDSTTMKGWYNIALTTADTDTLGELIGLVTATGADPFPFKYNVEANIVSDVPISTINTNLDATVSSRSTFAGGAVASVTAAVTVGTNNDKTGYSLSTAPPTAVEVRTEMDSNSTKLANLDATVASRLATAGYTAPLDASATRTALGLSTNNLDTQLSTIDGVVDAIKAKTDNLPAGVKKNTALSNFEFLMVSATDHITPVTGATITAERSIDGASFSSCSNSAAEVSAGVYKINLSAADMNGDVITFKFTATGADARIITAVTNS